MLTTAGSVGLKEKKAELEGQWCTAGLGTRAPVLQGAPALTGGAGGAWAGAHGVALAAPRLFVCAG